MRNKDQQPWGLFSSAIGRGLHEGFVLIAVLSVTALLALMLGGATLLARGSIDTAGVEKNSLRAQSLLTSGIALAGHQLFVLRMNPSALNGQQIRLNYGTVTLFVAAEAGKVDLNGADATLLAAAYRASRMSGLSPDEFAARVIDWRDADDDTSPQGAELPEYASAGLTYAPPNAPFRSIGDLRWVLGVGPTDVPSLAPFLTVSNPAGKIDPRYAASALLSAISGVRSDVVLAVAALAVKDARDQMFQLRSIFRGLESNVVLGEALRVFSVRVEARLDSDGKLNSVETVLIAPVLARLPYQITQWVER